MQKITLAAGVRSFDEKLGSIIAAILFLLAVNFPCAAADAWPAFRGENGQGSSATPILDPSHTGLKVKWSAHLPGSGHSTPVIQDGTVFVTAAYTDARGRSIMLIGRALAAAAAVALALAIFLRWPLEENSLRAFLGVAMNLGLLFILIVAGDEITGCNNDPFRTAILRSLTAAVVLNTARLMTLRKPRGQSLVIVASIFASLFGIFIVSKMAMPRQMGILFGSTLFPLCVGALTLRDRLSRTAPSSWARLAPWIVGAFPVAVFLYVTIRTENSAFWRVQSTPPLRITAPHLAVCGGMIALGLALFWIGRKSIRARFIGMVWAGWGLVIGLPIFAAPLINAFKYTKYHLVRGHLGSPLGMKGTAIACGLLLATTFALATPRAWRERIQRSNVFAVMLVILPLLAGALPEVSTLLGASAGSVCAMVAVNLENGNILWHTEGLKGKSEKQINAFNSPATPSPVIVGDLVVGYFGDHGAFACVRQNGKIAWVNTDLPYQSAYGAASSLIATTNLVILQSDSEKQKSFVAGLSAENGRPVWKYEREEMGSWRTPVLFPWKGRQIICSWAKLACDFVDAADGKRLRRLAWFRLGLGDPVSTPIIIKNNLFLTGREWLLSFPLAEIMESSSECMTLDLPDAIPAEAPEVDYPKLKPKCALNLDGEGPICGSPASDGQRYYITSDDGILWGISPEDGKVLWKAETDATRSSVIVAGNDIFTCSEAGDVKAFRIGSTNCLAFATARLRDPINASPAASGKSLIVRTRFKLHCLIGQ